MNTENTDLVVYEEKYLVYIKDEEDPILISKKGGLILQKILEDKECPPFVRILNGSYNRFEIRRVVPADEVTNLLEKCILFLTEDQKHEVRRKMNARRAENFNITEGVIKNCIASITQHEKL